MTLLPSSPPITLRELINAYPEGATNLRSYLAGGSIVASNTSNGTSVSIPSSGNLSLATFCGVNTAFTPVHHLYANNNGSFVETIPGGATNVTIEIWGAGGGGMAYAAGSGSYSRSVYTVSGDGGETIDYTLATGGIGGSGGSANAYSATSTVSSGTFAITTMTVNSGIRGTNTGPGAGGAVGTGGNQSNVAGNPGASSGPNGGAAVTGVYASGQPGGNQEADGCNTVVSFYYQ